MENNEPAREPHSAISSSIGNRWRDARWKGDELWFQGRVIATIVQDGKYAQMWRVRLPTGELSDMTNRIRAKDAALYLSGSNA